MKSIPKIIYIATKNKDRFKNIVESLRLINKNIKLRSINRYIPEYKEIGKNSRENAKLKAKYYFIFKKNNLITEDDSIYFNNLPKEKQPGHLIKNFIQSIGKSQKKWKKFFSEYKIKKGKIIKYFCFISSENKKIKCCKVEIPFVLKIISPIKKSSNFLNNFIIPIGFHNTLTQMSKKEKIAFRKKYITPVLKKLLKNLI